MKTRALASIALAGCLLLSVANVLAKPAGCPCSPCTCSPCSCGGGKGGKHHHHDKEGVRAGVGVNVDLGGVGHRSREGDPFAVGGGQQPTARTQEKHKSKSKEQEVTTNNPFTEIKLTGTDAKAESAPPTSVNVSNDEIEPPPVAPAETLKKDNSGPVTVDDLKKFNDSYYAGLKKFHEAQPNWKQLVGQAYTSEKMTEGVKKKSEQAQKKIQKLTNEFNQSDEGKKLIDDWKTAYDSAIKSGAKVPSVLLPPPQNDMEKKKYAVAQAENSLQHERDMYDLAKQKAVNSDDDVKKISQQIQALDDQYPQTKEGKVAVVEKKNQLKDDLQKAQDKAGNAWAASEDAKKQMKAVHEAEGEVDKAKQAYKPYEQFEEKPTKAASNP